MPVATGKVVAAKPGESRFAFSTKQQAWLSPCKLTGEDTGAALSAFELQALEAARVLRQILPSVPLFLFTMHKDVLTASDVRALKIGAVISKTDNLAVLAEHIVRSRLRREQMRRFLVLRPD